jgi:AcrR family transcriptional regulator
MGIKERKEQEKSEMRELIQKTAMNLFLDKGFENITIRHIAEKIDYSPATIYLYFKNKDEILYTLRREGFEELYRRQKDSLKLNDPLKRLFKNGEAYISFALENPQYYDLMFMMRGHATNPKKMNDMNISPKSYELLKNNLKECMEKGLFPGMNIDVAAFSLWAYVHGIASLIIRGRGIMFPEEEINYMVKGALNFMLEVIPDKKLDSENNINEFRTELKI